MTESTERDCFQRLVQRLEPQSKLVRSWELKGGVSAQVTALEIEQLDGKRRKVVVRRHGAADISQNPHVAADEFKLMELLKSVGVAAPVPFFLDQSGEIFSTPYVVIEYIEGKTEFTPADVTDHVFQLAAQLSRIHSVDVSKLDLSFLPKLEKACTEKIEKRPAITDESLGEGRIRDVLEAVWPFPSRNPCVLLHGDFWPGNVMWRDGQLAAVIDWEDAQLGDPLADVANARLEILWAFGIEAMLRFTGRYQSLTKFDFTDLSYWDLFAALRPASKISDWGLDASTEQKMREEHSWFVAQAFEKIGTGKGKKS